MKNQQSTEELKRRCELFMCAQPQQYAWMKRFFPTIYAQLKEAVQQGQWEPVGSMWVECDCNIPSGESLVRQVLHGKKSFIAEFGFDSREAWMPHASGFSAAFPQILRKAGIESFRAKRSMFPHDRFLWEGIDGTRIFAYAASADDSVLTPEELSFSPHFSADEDRMARELLLYAYKGALDELQTVTLERLKLEQQPDGVPMWFGELNETQHSIYTSRSQIKRSNRKSELLLHDAEFFDVIANATTGETEISAPAPERAHYEVCDNDEQTARSYFDRAWKLLLLNQSQGIIAGSLAEAAPVARDHETIATLARAVLEPARQRLIEAIDTNGMRQPVVVFNTIGHARAEIISLPDGSPMRVEVPACGYAVVDAAEQGPVSSFAAPVEVFVKKRLTAIDNGMLRVIFDQDGLIHSIRDHRLRREILAPGERGNLFQMRSGAHCKRITELERIEMIEQTPLRSTVEIVRAFRSSRITQRITLCAGSPRIDFETEVEWHEEGFLQVAFPLNITAAHATYEIQFGHLERPTHINTSSNAAVSEVCAQKWADLSEGDYGVALLNDCKYGCAVRGGVMQLNLLAPATDPAEHGKHLFKYSLLPHLGDFRQGQVIQQSYNLNVPLQVVSAGAKEGKLPKARSFFEVDRPGVILETVKKAESDDAVIVRLYEAYGTRGPARLRTSLPVKKVFAADLMERTTREIEMNDGEIPFHPNPFEIVTLKLLID